MDAAIGATGGVGALPRSAVARWGRCAIAYALESYLILGACAAGLCWETSALLGISTQSIQFYLFVFFATVAIYNLHSLALGAWSDRSRRWLALAAAVGTVVCLPSLHHGLWWPLGVLAVLSISYSVPLLPGRRRLRELGLAKIAAVVLVWTAVTIGLPVAGGTRLTFTLVLITLRRLAFMFALAMAFDLRDASNDASHGIRTLAVRIGAEAGYRLISLSLAIHVCLTIILLATHPRPGQLHISLALFLTAAIAMLAIHFTRQSPGQRFYLACVDGLMLVQSGLVWVAMHA